MHKLHTLYHGHKVWLIETDYTFYWEHKLTGAYSQAFHSLDECKHDIAVTDARS